MYQFTAKAGEVANWLAAFLLIHLLVSYLGHHAIVTGFCLPACLAVVYLILAILQYTWQGVGCEIFSRSLGKAQDNPEWPSSETEVEEWPWYIAFGGWLFYGLKMATIIVAAIIFIVELWP